MVSPSDPSGLATGFALAQGARPEGSGAPAPSQGALFGAAPADADGVGALDWDAAPAPRGRGRPPGSRNRSTEDWSRYLLTRYRSPLIGLAEIAQASPAAMVAELGGAEACSLLDALKVIMQAQQALAPYLHQKQPTAIDGGGVGLMTVIIQSGAGAEAAQAFDIRPIEESEEYQSLSHEDRARLEDGGWKE